MGKSKWLVAHGPEQVEQKHVVSGGALAELPEHEAHREAVRLPQLARPVRRRERPVHRLRADGEQSAECEEVGGAVSDH